MTEIALRDTAHRDMTIPAPVGISDPTGGRLVAWAEGLAAAHRIGTALCQTSFVPQHFRGKPEEAAAAILYGDEIGFTPTQSVQNLYVIGGKPALYARSMVALVMSKGHEVWTVEKSDAKVTVAGRRKGTTHVIEETWTPARATKAGYSNNKKYNTDPQAMLYARAAADVCRQIAPDALAGLAYSAEEMELTEDSPTTTVRRTEPKTRAQRKPVEPPIVAPEPNLEPAPEPDALDPDVRTEAQSRAMWAALRGIGLKDDDAKAFITDVLGRKVETTKTLSRAECSRVIDAANAATAEPDPWAAEEGQ